MVFLMSSEDGAIYISRAGMEAAAVEDIIESGLILTILGMT
jgi:hypothetical protein